jgi:hypothetical protein
VSAKRRVVGLDDEIALEDGEDTGENDGLEDDDHVEGDSMDGTHSHRNKRRRGDGMGGMQQVGQAGEVAVELLASAVDRFVAKMEHHANEHLRERDEQLRRREEELAKQQQELRALRQRYQVEDKSFRATMAGEYLQVVTQLQQLGTRSMSDLAVALEKFKAAIAEKAVNKPDL